MNPVRTLAATFGLLALSGIAAGTASAGDKHFHIHDPDQKKTELLDRCIADTCAKVKITKGDAVRITLEDVSAKKVILFRISFKDDVTGKFVTKTVLSLDGTTGVIEGLTVEKGKLQIFSVQTCFQFKCNPVKVKFSFNA